LRLFLAVEGNIKFKVIDYTHKINKNTKRGKKMGFIIWIVLGLIAGAIAKAIYPGHQGGGFIATSLLGIVGALVGGWIGNIIFPGSVGAAAASAGAITIGGIIFAVLGALVVLFVWSLLAGRTA